MLCLCCPRWHLAACRGVVLGSSKEQSSRCVVYNIRPWAGPRGDWTSLHSDSWRGSLPGDVGENILKDSARKQRKKKSNPLKGAECFFLHITCLLYDLDRRAQMQQGRGAGCCLFWPLIPQLKLSLCEKLVGRKKNCQDGNTEQCLKAAWRGILSPAAACRHTHTPSCLSTSDLVLVWVPALFKPLRIRLSVCMRDVCRWRVDSWPHQQPQSQPLSWSTDTSSLLASASLWCGHWRDCTCLQPCCWSFLLCSWEHPDQLVQELHRHRGRGLQKVVKTAQWITETPPLSAMSWRTPPTLPIDWWPLWPPAGASGASRPD